MEEIKIETITDINGNEVSFSPDRGGMVTSLKFNNKEIFYFDAETFNNKDVSVRGGLPILFPNAGELSENKKFPNLKRHGFARDLKWESKITDDKFSENITWNNETLLVYPYKFSVNVSGFFKDKNTFVFMQEIKNMDEVDMPISSGLHPYFFVPDSEKKNIKFNFIKGGEVSDKFDVWSNGGTVVVSNPQSKNIEEKIEIFIPGTGIINLKINPKYKKIWFWSILGKDFICIEPMIGEEDGLLLNPEIIKKGESLTLDFSIFLLG